MAWDESDMGNYVDGFRMLEGETLAGLLADYDQVAQRTDNLVRSLPDLDASPSAARGPMVRRGRAPPAGCCCT